MDLTTVAIYTIYDDLLIPIGHQDVRTLAIQSTSASGTSI